MVAPHKVLYINSDFTKELQPDGEAVIISGYASTTDIDRHGDVVPSAVWEKGLGNYLKNPIILAYHDHAQPVGRMVEHKVDSRGLWIKARISQASGNIYTLIKDGILSAFSIGFKIVDAEYNQATELFVVKELELHEISIVSVPANQNTLFSLSKAFETAEEYKSFVMHFAPKSESAKGLESSTEAEGKSIIKEWKMNPEELKQALADAARQAAEEATKSILAQQEKQATEKAQQEKADRDLEGKIKAAVAATVETGKSGAERLLEEVEKRFQTQADESRKAIEGLEAVLKEKAQELDAIQKSKMHFADGRQGAVDYKDKEKAVILAKMTGKSIEGTKFGRELVEKAGPHLPSNTWELEVSLRMEEEVRRRLVVAPTLRNIAMQTNVMTIPVNPEAGTATWITNAQFGTADSKGATQTHLLKEITLNAYKVATNEYMAYEEEEDSLLALMPVVRDAMIRRVARAVDRAFLRGAGAGADPVKGLATYDAVSAVNLDISDATKATIATLRALRADLGVWGLDPAEVLFVVSSEVYYDLLEDTNFMTVDKVGPAATILTGQIGTVANVPVLVSGEFESKGAGAVAAIAYAPGNFVVGNQRGLRMDTQDLVETQRKVMVASLRTGMTQITTNLGGAVSALRYVA